jgi:uncharacterized protein
MRIGVIADTHIADPRQTIPREVLQAFDGVACILHAGDILLQSVLDTLAAIAPVHAVYGNCDPPVLSWRLPDRLVLDLEGTRIGLTHGHLGNGATTPQRALAYFRETAGLHAVVFGHSHDPHNELHNGILLFNPGSPTQRRRQLYPSFGLLDISQAGCSGEIVYLR